LRYSIRVRWVSPATKELLSVTLFSEGHSEVVRDVINLLSHDSFEIIVGWGAYRENMVETVPVVPTFERDTAKRPVSIEFAWWDSRIQRHRQEVLEWLYSVSRIKAGIKSFLEDGNERDGFIRLRTSDYLSTVLTNKL